MANDEKIKEDPSLTERLRDPVQRRGAFTEVISRYSRALYWQIRRMVQCHEDADDLLQNTFMKAWSSLDAFRGEARLGTWLYKIAINESISFLERERRRLSITDSEQSEALIEAIASDPFTDGDEIQRRLREAVARLPEKQRLVFNMRYYDEMKYEEMSRVLGTSVGALKASYHLAVKKIEQYLE